MAPAANTGAAPLARRSLSPISLEFRSSTKMGPEGMVTCSFVSGIRPPASTSHQLTQLQTPYQDKTPTWLALRALPGVRPPTPIA